MPIIQINLYVCEVPGCGKHLKTVQDVGLYSDPVVTLPDDEWEYIEIDTVQQGRIEVLACGDCVRKYGPED